MYPNFRKPPFHCSTGPEARETVSTCDGLQASRERSGSGGEIHTDMEVSIGFPKSWGYPESSKTRMILVLKPSNACWVELCRGVGLVHHRCNALTTSQSNIQTGMEPGNRGTWNPYCCCAAKLSASTMRRYRMGLVRSDLLRLNDLLRCGRVTSP